ncbi:MAG: DNA polymerase III subunit beta [Desulfosalsimonadaceae bacterium]
MRITIKKEAVSEVLSRIQGLTGKKTSLAITENVLLKTVENGITLTATDLETGFEGVYPAEVKDPGEIAINARKFNEIVKNFPTEEIEIQELENKWIEISSQTVEYHIVGMDPEEFPNVPKIDHTDLIPVDSVELKKMIDRSVVVSVAGNEKRAHLIGVLLSFMDNKADNIIRMVSTDFKRLSKVDYHCGKGAPFPEEKSVIIPKKGLGEIYKFLENEGKVEIGIQENHFIVKKENEYAIVNLMEGKFPPYDELLQTDPEYDILFDRSRLMMMLRRMTILTSEDYRGVIFHFNNDEFTIRTVNAVLGESKETMDIPYDGEPKEIAFNPKYFLEAISFITQEKVVLNVKNDENPCIVRGEKDMDYLNIIMPMKI